MSDVRRRAVVADKDEAIRRAAMSVLGDLRIDADEVDRVEQLLQSLDASEPDLLFIDLGMVSVLQVKEFRRRRPSMNVLMTCAAGLARRLGADFGTLLEVGATDFLPKPFSRAQLIHRLRVLDAIKPFIGLAPPPLDPTGALLLGLHHAETGRIDARLLAGFLGVSLRGLSDALGRNYRTIHKTPHSASLQPELQTLRRIIELLVELVGTQDAARAWLNTPSPDLSGETPIALLMSGHADSVRSLLENVAAGAPT
jgi:CheY-like chemotaxis protein